MYYGPGQDQPGADGVGDSPYNDIQGDKSALDRYPLMSPGSPPQPPTFGIGLWPGWNFVSVPAEAADTSVEGVLASMSGSWDTVKYYDAGDASDPWKTFRPGGQSNDLDRIDRGMGFWVHATENCTLLTYDPAPGSTAIPLRAGWNMVGYPTLTERPVSDALWGTSADRVEVFDSASPELLREMAPTELMQPGMGYWVHVPVDSVWTIDW